MLSSAQSNQTACFEAYEAFWKMIKNAKATMAKRKVAGKSRPLKPRFKSRHEGRQSYYVSSQMCKFKHLDFMNRTLKMSKLGEVKFYYRKIRDDDDIISIRESRLVRAYDQYHLSLTVVLKRKDRESKGNIHRSCAACFSKHCQSGVRRCRTKTRPHRSDSIPAYCSFSLSSSTKILYEKPLFWSSNRELLYFCLHFRNFLYKLRKCAII